MARLETFKFHHAWEDMIGAALGLIILVSQFAVSAELPTPVLITTITVGFLVLCMSLFEIIVAGRWEEVIGMALGLWLALGAFFFDYGAAGQLRVWHFLLGALVVLTEAFELWQDWRRPA